MGISGDTQLIDFVEGLGPAQMVGRQVLGMCLNESESQRGKSKLYKFINYSKQYKCKRCNS